MSDVISLSGATHASADLEAKLLRAEGLRGALARKEPFNSEDQERTARNLNKVIAHFRSQRRLDVREMLRRVGLAGDGNSDSTKRLDTYTLPDDASDERKRRIRKTPRKYFEIAEALASIVREPEAFILSQIFEGCSYGTEFLPEGDWDSENWARLTQLINLMATSVIIRNHLDKYWQKVRLTNGEYDVRERKIKAGNGSLYNLRESYGLAGGFLCSDEIPPVPSVVLGRKRAAAPILGWIELEDESQLEVQFTFWLQVRLALAPVNHSSSIGALLEFRTILDARDHDLAAITFDNPYTDSTDRILLAMKGRDVIKVRGLALNDYELVPKPEFRDGAEHSYFSWRELSPALLRKILGQIEQDPEDRFTFQSDLEAWSVRGVENRFPSGSAAAALYASLLSGNLEGRLNEVCKALTRQVEEHRESCVADMRAAEAAAMARWATLHTDLLKETEDK